MTPWTIFFIGSLLLTLLFAGNLFLRQHRHSSGADVQTVSHDARLLILLGWLASLSILAYVAFAFGKR